MSEKEKNVRWKVTVERVTTIRSCGDEFCNCASHRSRPDIWTFYPDRLTIDDRTGLRYEIHGDTLATVPRDSQ